jgi:hypothetical protein
MMAPPKTLGLLKVLILGFNVDAKGSNSRLLLYQKLQHTRSKSLSASRQYEVLNFQLVGHALDFCGLHTPRDTPRQQIGHKQCPPNMAQQVGDKAFQEIVPSLQARGGTVVTQISLGPLITLTDTLMARYAGSRVLDARRPKFVEDLQPASHQQPQAREGLWVCAAALAGVGVLVTAD